MCQIPHRGSLDPERHSRQPTPTRPRVAGLLIALSVFLVARPAEARQVLLVANGNTNTVGQYNANTGATINAAFVYAPGPVINGFSGLVRDGNNHLLVGDFQNNTVGQFDATTGATINAAFLNAGRPMGMVVDGNNNLFVVNGSLSNTVGQYDATTGATINPAFINGQGLDHSRGMVMDGNNHLIVANYNGFGNGTVGKYDATTGATINSAFIIRPAFGPYALALDSLNNLLFVSDQTANSVGEYNATTGATINANFITGLHNPLSLALDGNNHLFVANNSNSTVGEYNATTGATINAAFINGQGLSSPTALLFVAGVPEPSSLALVAAATGAAIGIGRRKWFAARRSSEPEASATVVVKGFHQ